jgi:hypothetical protein
VTRWGAGLEVRPAAVFAVIYSKLSASGLCVPQKSWCDGALADLKTAGKQQKNSEPSAALRSAPQTYHVE